MKGLNEVSKLSKEASHENRVSVYYSIAYDTVYTEDGKGRWYITDLIRYNTPMMIKDAVKKYMDM